MDNSRTFEIPVWVDHTQKWLSGLSKRTTCDDIVYAILYNQNQHETNNTDSYAIFERWKGIEKALQGRTKILRVWRNWASEQANVHFIMRRVDNIIPSPEYLVTKRRYKKWRHRRRLLADQSSNTPQSHCCDCMALNQGHAGRYGYLSGRGLGFTKNGDALDHDKLRHLQKTIRTVMAQEKKIKSIASRLEETDVLIEKYEDKIHFYRTRKKGINYVQRSLLHDSTSTSEDSLEDFISKSNIDLLEEYVEACDQLIGIWEKLITEKNTIENLVSQIKQYGIEPCTAISKYDKDCNCKNNSGWLMKSGSEEKSGDGSMVQRNWSASAVNAARDDHSELEAVDTEFNRVLTVSVIQNITSEQLDKEMMKYERQIEDKGRLIASLENELQLTKSVAKPLSEPDVGGLCHKSRDGDPGKYTLKPPAAVSDVHIKTATLQRSSQSEGSCASPEQPGTGGGADDAVLRKENEGGTNGCCGSHAKSSSFRASTSFAKNLTPMDGSLNDVFQDNKAVIHSNGTSNSTVDNKFISHSNTHTPSTITTTTSTTTNNNTCTITNNKQLISYRKGPRIGIAGGALRTDFCRTKSKRDWLTVLPSTDKNGNQEQITPGGGLSWRTDGSVSASDADSKAIKYAEGDINIKDQPQDEAASRIGQSLCSFAPQHQYQKSQEEDFPVSSRLVPSSLDKQQLLITSDSISGVSIFKLDKSDDTDSTSDTGLGSMNSEEFNASPMETLV